MGPDPIMDALEVAFAATVPGLRFTRGFVAAEQIQSGMFPHLSLYSPSEAADVLRMGQREQTWTILGLLATYKLTIVETRAMVEDLRTGLEADPTLGALVDTSWLTLDGSAADENHGEAVLTITSVGVY